MIAWMNGAPRMATTATRMQTQQQTTPVNARPAGGAPALAHAGRPRPSVQHARTAEARRKEVARVGGAADAARRGRQLGVLVGLCAALPGRVALGDSLGQQLDR